MPEKRLQNTRRVYEAPKPRPKLSVRVKRPKRPNSTSARQWNEREGGMHS